MSDKKKLMDLKRSGLTYDAGVLLGKLAENLRAGKLVCESEEHPASLDLPVEMDLEICIKEKTKRGAIKRKVEIELSWVETSEE